jgi:hypothetical protein
MQSLPWAWTNLPVTPKDHKPQNDTNAPVLLSPTALRDLVRHVRDLSERDRVGSSR